MRKQFVFGDIHGCYREFCDLMAMLSPQKGRDCLIFLGDMIDRGRQSKEVVSAILNLKKDYEIIGLMGNHEQAFLDYLQGKAQDFYLQIGGLQTVQSYGFQDFYGPGLEKQLPADHMRFFKELRPYWEDENYIYVHAGLKAKTPLPKQSAEWLFWGGGGKFMRQRHDFGKRVVFGHTAFDAPLLEPERIGIDTGAVYGGHLTCLVLPDMEFVQVKSKKYWPF